MNSEICAQLNRFAEELSAAVAEHRFEQVAGILAAQQAFVVTHLDLLDEGARREIQHGVETSLLLAKASRAHCIDAILANQRKLGVLTAYQSA